MVFREECAGRWCDIAVHIHSLFLVYDVNPCVFMIIYFHGLFRVLCGANMRMLCSVYSTRHE